MGSGSEEQRRVAIIWEALEDAFENNAPEVHSYLHVGTGEVIRIVDGIADPGMHSRIVGDSNYLRIDPVSSREQYRWMERFIATVEDGDLRQKLLNAIDGKGAFRRFKDVLMHFPVDRERWFAFRSDRLRVSMESWLEAHGIDAIERDQWDVPSAEDVMDAVEREENERPERRNRAAMAAAARNRLQELVNALPVRELDAAAAFLEFLRERKHLPRATAKQVDRQPTSDTDEDDSAEGDGNES
jgi:hypothetical protein